MNTVIVNTAHGELEISIYDGSLFVATKGDKETAYIEAEEITPELKAKIETYLSTIQELQLSLASEVLPSYNMESAKA